MAFKLMVGNLSYDTDDGSLQRMFSSCGQLTEAKVITDRDTGRSRGFAFVTFADQNGFDAAQGMNGMVRARARGQCGRGDSLSLSLSACSSYVASSPRPELPPPLRALRG
mmetsp:Transcript_1948/g.7145  ORF Transcript_1948/g.7145 Transcript_1948/m.7145 type:complete len:110 (+) Transcript_1948:111-440(+)|eukprot:CAMPEP_0170132644 /NCGR_PEP_ID=MMETSP0033_2-20121228/622_1 /TAXON_ID=195969 /ORGANISM="Dolichomastix tenuilepis, Strain CCMP3274" /LENGTH=109 /DNA_ID=CAMNT_0010368049 /DNA_START=85 /DNA_END=414 /DNA_ORIENTATION=+